MTFNRRQLLIGGAALWFASRALTRPAAAAEASVNAALDQSALIYLTPLRAGGRESSCHGEVWFVHHKGDIYVSTATAAWRSVAVRSGFPRARVWIGEFGLWKRAKEAFRAAPSAELEGRIETDTAVHAEVLEVFGRKYAAEWDKWGPRFRDGLVDGSRVLLRYRVMS